MLIDFISRTTLTPARHYIKFEQHCHRLLSSLSTTSHSSNQHSFTVSYLINSCGFSPESAILASKRVDLSKSPNTAGSVLAVLKKLGFTKSQISTFIYRNPRFLLCDPEKTLLPNFQILSSIGLSNTDLVAIATTRPKFILSKRFQDRTLLSVDYLRTILGSDDKVIMAIKRFPIALTYDLQVYASENIQMLLELGVPNSRIIAMLAQQPRTFFTSAGRFREVVTDVLEMGFDPKRLRFLWAIHAIRAMSKSTWNKKMEVYMKWGWSKEEIFIAFERYPGFMMASMEKITRILDFLVNTMGWERSFIVQWPIVIAFSLEKRIIPRCLVYQYLEEKGLVEEDNGFCFTNWLMYSEKKFLKWVVKRYEDEASEILKLYQKHLNEVIGSTASLLRNRDVI